MNFKELFDSLPQLIQLLVPGFIFLIIYNFFVNKKSKHYEITIVGSIILTYIFNLICEVANTFRDFSTTTDNFITVVLAIISAIIFVKISSTKKYKIFLAKIGRITGDDDVWHTIFDLNAGSCIRFFCIYNHCNVEISGILKYYDVISNGECNIVLSEYTITYGNGNIYTAPEQALLYVNSNNIHGLEIL